MDILGWFFVIIGVVIVLALLFAFIKAAAKSAVRDVLEEWEQTKKQEEASKRW